MNVGRYIQKTPLRKRGYGQKSNVHAKELKGKIKHVQKAL